MSEHEAQEVCRYCGAMGSPMDDGPACPDQDACADRRFRPMPENRFVFRPNIDPSDREGVKQLAADIASWLLAARDRVQRRSEARREETVEEHLRGSCADLSAEILKLRASEAAIRADERQKCIEEGREVVDAFHAAGAYVDAWGAASVINRINLGFVGVPYPWGPNGEPAPLRGGRKG